MPSPPPFVALGDSYAAGVGGGAKRNECWRAVEGYPVLVARTLGLHLAYQACLGATIDNVERDQAQALGPETTHVSLTVGGNDIGFVPVLIECAKPSWVSDSDPVIDDALAILRTQLPERLAGLLATIGERAPNAELVVTAYPVLFNGEDCNALTFFSPHEMGRIKDGVDELAGVIGAATHDAGADFVDPRGPFTGHAICDDPEWLNGASLPLEQSFHPNADGHAAYARLVTTAFDAESADLRPERDVRVVEGPARRGDAPTFRLPDLLSPQSLDGARRHGLDPSRVEALVREGRHDVLHDLDRELRLALGK
ncbi:putative secreted hydrolase [Janibacter sp. HTCC2649]|uniref:SGNH/GDSL hydrolase family protein n=1 Tax=Janibacter sp. HTCC2649 TaxID=313589 RepID=UPI00006719BC|nr:SGNH/GDSL hydrolase family protein [Janibacter sp. HTCC2649]EAP98191.1 putative secreted hydrolase [Janibacter sp. HTCC2649]